MKRRGMDMAWQYFIYPFKVMGISQTYNGSFSHRKYSTGNRKDYPIDEAGADTGRDWMYAPADMVVKKIYGRGDAGRPNTVWLQTQKKVITPSGIFYVTGRVTHMSDSDIRNLKVGDRFKAREKMFREGTDGGATGNHIHMAWGIGKYRAPGWSANSNGAYVLTTTGSNKKPENIFFVDREFTTIKSSGGLKFRNKPTPKTRYVNTPGSRLNVRKTYRANSEIVGKLEDNAKVIVYAKRNKRSLIGVKKWVASSYLKKRR